mgnify:CR=1 FL=1
MDVIKRAAASIEEELEDRLDYFDKMGKPLEKERLEQRCRYDIEALKEFGVCPGIETIHDILMDESQGKDPTHCLIIFQMIFYWSWMKVMFLFRRFEACIMETGHVKKYW